jgi:mRNA interferase RelE/StbE
VKYRVKVIAKAEKDLDAASSRDFDFIKRKIFLLSENPRPFGCRKLTADEGHRIRCGDFRVLYRIDDPAKEVMIYRIRHRREVYR